MPTRMLWLSTFAFAASFAVWTIFSIIGIGIQAEFGLSEAEFGLLISVPILTGSLSRLFLGIASDRLGGRLVTTLTMLASVARGGASFRNTSPCASSVPAASGERSPSASIFSTSPASA